MLSLRQLLLKIDILDILTWLNAAALIERRAGIIQYDRHLENIPVGLYVPDIGLPVRPSVFKADVGSNGNVQHPFLHHAVQLRLNLPLRHARQDTGHRHRIKKVVVVVILPEDEKPHKHSGNQNNYQKPDGDQCRPAFFHFLHVCCPPPL